MRMFPALAVVLLLAACGGAEPKWASDEAVAAARFVAAPPPSVTLYTVVSTRDGSGAHSALLINADERVMFDPAGTWHHPRLPERNDVHFGMTDRMVDFYIDYHARETYRVIEQRLPVTPEVAAAVKARALAYGAVPKAQCTNSVTAILRGVPGFEGMPSTWFPRRAMEAFAALPGVTTRTIADDDATQNHGVLIVQHQADLAADAAPAN
jgi:hypothetical protein